MGTVFGKVKFEHNCWSRLLAGNQALSSNSRTRSDEVMALLSPTERQALARLHDQELLKLWKRSFKREAIKDEEMYWACIRYIHLNPVRKEICERTIDYEWSSAMMFEECRWREGTGIMEAFD